MLRRRVRNPRMRESCICGAAIWLAGVDTHSDTEVMTLWQNQHLGPGHGPCTPRRARNAREYRQRRQRQGLPVGARKSGEWGYNERVDTLR
jgi:hypothetical protein